MELEKCKKIAHELALAAKKTYGNETYDRDLQIVLDNEPVETKFSSFLITGEHIPGFRALVTKLTQHKREALPILVDQMLNVGGASCTDLDHECTKTDIYAFDVFMSIYRYAEKWNNKGATANEITQNTACSWIEEYSPEFLGQAPESDLGISWV